MKSVPSSRGEGTDPYEEKWAEEEYLCKPSQRGSPLSIPRQELIKTCSYITYQQVTL